MNNNEYIVQPNEKGGYDLILGEEILDMQITENLIAELKMRGIIPVKAEVTIYINGITYMSRLKENAQVFTDDRLMQSDTINNSQSQYLCENNTPIEKQKVKTK